ncbi:MAG TPA: hypothetical protein VFI39_10710 [Gemmatimonadales bacterium]|nr:hypothetical protein [Gemmatimonadales bacterium]
MLTRLFRWKAVVPLVVFLGVVCLGWLLFADMLGRRAVIAVGTKMTGAEVDLAAFHVHLLRGSVELDGLQVANAADLSRNSFEAGQMVLDLDPAALFEKKLVIDRLAATGVRIGARRRTPARPIPKVAADSASALAAAKAFASKVSVPLLRLTPVDSIKALVLDPSQLKSLQAAAALQRRSDSASTALRSRYDSLALPPVLDSSKALAARMAKFNAGTAGVAGVQQAVKDLNQGIARIKDAEARVAALQRTAAASAATLSDGARALDAARQQDYGLARGLLKLPTVSPTDISAALFGPMVTERFQQVVYWSALARKYMPAGMLPRKDPGPKRIRMAGTTVRFPLLHQLPTFLLRRGDLGVSFGGDSARDYAFTAAVQGATSDPALYGRLTTFTGKGQVTGKSPMSIDLGGALDHTGPVAVDSASGIVTGIALPTFQLPGLNYSAVPGAGTASLSFTVRGDQLHGRWTVTAPQVSWVRDSSAGGASSVDQLIGKVLRGIGTLSLQADLSGTLAAPQVAVRSNVGDAVASGVSAMLGQAARDAEAKARAEVDRQVGKQVAAAKAKVADVEQQGNALVADAQSKLEDQRKQLEARLQGLAKSSLPGGIKF